MEPERIRFRCADDGVELHAMRWGAPELPLLVLLHGAGANAHWWDHLAPALAVTHHAVALDFRGHGDSEYPDGVEAGAFGRDLAALLDHLEAGRYALAGHSLGAGVALAHAAGQAPGLSRLALIEIARGASTNTRRAARLALALRRTYATRETAEAKFQPLPATRSIDESLRRAIAAHSVRAEPDGRFGFKFDARWFGAMGAARPDPARVRCPTLVIRGADSRLLTPEGFAALRGSLPDASFVEVPDAGHHVQLDRPAAVLSALQDFLTGDLPDAGMLGSHGGPR